MNSPNSPAPSGRLSSIMQEDRLFPPSAEFSKRARIQSMEDYRRIYADAMEHPEKFWDNLAKLLPWTTPYTRVLDWQPPCARGLLADAQTLQPRALISTWRPVAVTKEPWCGWESRSASDAN